MKSQDAEALSAYLDGQLSPSESQRLEERLHSEPELEELLADLRFARSALKRVPRRAVPRSFVLRPSMPQVRGPVPQSVPVLRLASVLAALVLVATFAINSLAIRAQTIPEAAPAPAYGLGGAGGAAPSPEALLQSNAAQAPGQSQDLSATPLSPTAVAPTAGSEVEALPKESPQALSRSQPRGTPHTIIPAMWQLLLGAMAALFGGMAWYAHRISRRNFTSRHLEK
jgi:anti-sigma factor RsiW